LLRPAKPRLLLRVKLQFADDPEPEPPKRRPLGFALAVILGVVSLAVITTLLLR
jgi:hypothetical protein